MSDTTEYNAAKGIVFNIQHYSIHDGTGIRTSVFLKGCFLHCVWCQNPESQSIKPELYYFEERCTGCGSYVATCPVHAIQIDRGKSFSDRNICNGSGKCVQVCPNDARRVMGEEMTAEEVFQKVKGDELFYHRYDYQLRSSISPRKTLYQKKNDRFHKIKSQESRYKKNQQW